MEVNFLQKEMFKIPFFLKAIMLFPSTENTFWMWAQAFDFWQILTFVFSIIKLDNLGYLGNQCRQWQNRDMNNKTQSSTSKKRK